jgi:hypothetical protein
MDLKPLKNEYTYVVNEFIKHEDFHYINPTFYSDIEPLQSLINLPKDHPYNPYNYYKRVDNALKPLNTILFFKDESKYFIEKNNLFVGKDIFYLQASSSLLTTSILEDDISKPNTFMNGVIFSAICNCVYMGFNKIYFIGNDCDFYKNKTESHFYQNITPTTLDNASNEELLFANYKILKAWRIATTYFKNKGINIYNAGIGGDNDVCERVNFCDLF